MGQITVFAGAFGSGKTEIALNFAIERARLTQYDEVFFTDLDTANPFFVARDAADLLAEEEKKMKIISPNRDLALSDVPNLPREIIGLLQTDNEMVLDLAGDKFGALVLGYVSKYIKARNSYDMYMVINPYRSFSANLEEVTDLKNLLESAAKINFNGIISNPNLVEETTLDLIKEGHSRVVGFAKELGIPVKYLAVEKNFYQALYPEYGSYLKSIKLYLRPDWIRDLGEGMEYG